MNIVRSLILVSVLSSRALGQNDPSWTEPFPPFKIAGNLYYVGSKGLANYLVTTPQGHILINSDLEANVPLIKKSIEQLGFKFNDVKILLISHAHWDHDAGSAAIKRMTGAQYMVMEQDVGVVESGGKTDFHYGRDTASLYPAVKVDRVLHDGDEVNLGDAVLVAHLTPGHTKGCTTWTMRVHDGSKTLNAVIVGSPNVNGGYKLVNNAEYPRIADDYEQTFRVLKSLPVDIFLGAHGSYFGMEAKYPRFKAGDASVWIDPAGYAKYVSERENAFRTELAKQKAGSPAAQTTPQQAVLVTGASSGIGRRVTERLAAQGYFVYAGARAQADLDALSAIKNVQGIRLDVTVPGDIAAAVQTITKAGRGLYGIVNNAGVVVVAPLIEVEEKDLDFIFNVNIYGPYRITKAFAPLVLEAKGRVVNISSLNGIVTSAMVGPYSMSKHAIEAYGDGLAAELSRFGVRVSLVEPGNYGTEIGKNLLARMDTSIVKGSRFEAQMRGAINSMKGFESYPPPDDVADAVLDAMSNANPRSRYLVVPAANQAALTLRKLMDEIVQMNDGQKFKYDRDALVKMLDDALARVQK